MKASWAGNAAQMPSFLNEAGQSTFQIYEDQQTATPYNAQAPIGSSERRNGFHVAMGDIMEDCNTNETYNTHADRQMGNEGYPMIQHSAKPLETLTNLYQSEAHLVSSTIDGESETQEADDGTKSPTRFSSSMGGDAHDDDEALDNHLPRGDRVEQHYNDAHHGQEAMFVDYEGDTEVDEVDEDDRSSASEQHNCIVCTHFRVHECAETRQTIEQHLAIPAQQSFPSLDDLLSSHTAPGRGLYKIEEILRFTNKKAADLEEKIQCLRAQLDAVSEIREEAREIVRQARTTFSETRYSAGISDRLWAEYEAFCESLEPKSGSRGGWSVTCFQNHNGSYISWDPDLDLFKDTAEISLKICNFRCEATTINHSNGDTEHVVDFWPLASLKPRTETARTWEQQYPELYRLAEEAANNAPGGNPVAQALLRSLPSASAPFSNGWLFEYTSESARAEHRVKSRRWSYRRACRIPVDGQQDSDHGELAHTSES